ncbi:MULTISPECIES: hypothetical protein [unclassified Ensifer]|uniref:hypothetical protein n=1 Tax=Ensifer TaxID=106591 RepID=UPI00070C0C2A|nr:MULTISPECIES: hypothetical protein [unclassified Ensifer]KQU96016.1 hypothetical protein ASD00_19885 [Ensifer sp. Root31]KQW34944.1 hypothetical protein ASD02_17220 [Ensifer sp. Root1252]KRC57268.1 hypothetical protein ASE32_20535 [Ensifer sp. Root231]KRC87763.1 hypothetical protein ASE47_14690 [Ensifer sp. Root258]
MDPISIHVPSASRYATRTGVTKDLLGFDQFLNRNIGGYLDLAMKWRIRPIFGNVGLLKRIGFPTTTCDATLD